MANPADFFKSLFRPYIVFLVSFAILAFFLTPNVNTGDAGELVTAAYFLGTAHPSGYPLYLLAAKALTFIPFGNMAFKVAIVSAIFSSLSITLIYRLMIRLTSSNTAAMFTGAMLLASYSYFTQSVIAKFYTLNLFFVLLLFFIWLAQLSKNTGNPQSASGGQQHDAHAALLKFSTLQVLYLTSFLFGLIASNHHTGILMLFPVISALILCRKEIFSSIQERFRNTALSMSALFFSGFVVNAYLLLRGGENHVFNVFYARNIGEFLRLISREAYGEGGTVSIALNAAASPFLSLSSSWNAFRNFAASIALNFSFFSLVLFLSGCFFLFKKNLKILIFSLVTLFVFGPLLAIHALSSPEMTAFEYYIAGNQYFLPAYAIYAFFLGLGFYEAMQWLKISKYKAVQKMLPSAIAVFFAVILSFRLADSNYRTNYVPYQSAKDTYSILPVNSIFIALGDNERYQGRYIKLIGRYREDICHLNAVTLQSAVIGLSGCRDASYGSISSQELTRDSAKIMEFIKNKRLYSDAAASEFPPLGEYASENKYSLIHLYLPKGGYSGGDVSAFLRKSLPIADTLINNDACATQRTDDIFTRHLCDKYDAHFLHLIDFYTSKMQKKGRSE